MSLSVLCPTRDPGPRVRALLEPLRDVADEIVVAIDSSAGEAEAGEYAAVADRVLRFERGPRHSALAWLHAQCRCDWVLVLAGDEVCSEELVAALPELTQSRSALQVAFSLRWLWPGPDQWLSGAPWYPDFHLRLVRNDATLRFHGRQHELAVPAWPHRFLDLPLWHLSLLVTDEAQRRAKIAANRADRQGLTAAGGDELNHAFYLPEDRDAPPLTDVPDADRAQIARVLGARSKTADAVSGIAVAPRAEIDPLWADRPVGDGAYHATIAPLSDLHLTMRPGEARAVYMRVRNDGDERWPWGLDHPPHVRLGYRWHGTARRGRRAGDEPEGRGAFPCEVRPGEDCIVPLPVTAPAARGRWELEVDVVHEHVRWFGVARRFGVTVD
jgi:hypothetical protein